jgi:hypothetical protein
MSKPKPGSKAPDTQTGGGTIKEGFDVQGGPKMGYGVPSGPKLGHGTAGGKDGKKK